MENFSAPEYPESSREPAQSSDALSQDQHSYPKIFVQCSLPYRNPQEYFWQRYNGDTTLTLTAGSYLDAQGQTHMHLPYGIYPRIILMYLASEALRTSYPTQSGRYCGIWESNGPAVPGHVTSSSSYAPSSPCPVK